MRVAKPLSFVFHGNYVFTTGYIQHMQADTKWSLFCRLHFPWKPFYFSSNFTDCCSYIPVDNNLNCGLTSKDKNLISDSVDAWTFKPLTVFFPNLIQTNTKDLCITGLCVGNLVWTCYGRVYSCTCETHRPFFFLSGKELLVEEQFIYLVKYVSKTHQSRPCVSTIPPLRHCWFGDYVLVLHRY